VNSNKSYWEYDHDYHEFTEELDYAYYEEDTWDRWKFFLPVTIIIVWIISLFAWSWWTTAPILRSPGILWAQDMMDRSDLWSVPVTLGPDNIPLGAGPNARSLFYLRPAASLKISPREFWFTADENCKSPIKAQKDPYNAEAYWVDTEGKKTFWICYHLEGKLK
jgi:hypothetical protein